MKRQRGRGRKPGGGGGGHGNHGNRPLESNGPEVKIRGTAAQIYEKYAQYARDAQSGGDRVKYENYLQHAEHYFRVMVATMPRDRILQQQEGGGMMPVQQQGGEGQLQSADGSVGGGEGLADPMKVMDDQAGDDDGDYEGDDEGGDGGDRDEVEAGAQDEGQGGANAGQNSERHGKRRRRGRRNRHQDDRGGDGGGGGGGGSGGGSALDSLARKQGALAGG
jgi:hypothetical protein